MKEHFEEEAMHFVSKWPKISWEGLGSVEDRPLASGRMIRGRYAEQTRLGAKQKPLGALRKVPRWSKRWEREMGETLGETFEKGA